jgi:hypothetical protein
MWEEHGRIPGLEMADEMDDPFCDVKRNALAWEWIKNVARTYDELEEESAWKIWEVLRELGVDTHSSNYADPESEDEELKFGASERWIKHAHGAPGSALSCFSGVL